MSFQKAKFIEYFTRKGDRNINTYCAYLNKLEQQFGFDIDEEYNRDACASLDTHLHSKYDEYRHSDPKLYNIIKQMRQGLRKYCEFQKNEDVDITDNANVASAPSVALRNPPKKTASEANVKQQQVGACTDVGLNTILYGPPGTGKTYHTTIYAVAIIENKSVEVVAKEDYENVLKRYNAYKSQGRIEFTTFHQSYGYEEFIEGIRPAIVCETDVSPTGDVQYSIQPGIFKKFCEKAELQSEVPENLIINGSSVWSITIEDEDHLEECLFDGSVGMPDFGVPPQFTDESLPDNLDGSIADSLVNFHFEISVGDVILLGRDESSCCAIGIVTSEAEYDDLEYENYPRRRRVDWVGKQDSVPLDLTNLRYAAHKSCRQLNIGIDDVAAYFFNYGGTEKNYVFVIDEINRGNISKIFGELITLIEESKRIGATEELQVVLPYSQTYFGIPKNVYIIGTMNTADRSIATIDTALRRRFLFKEMMPNPEVLAGISVEGVSISDLLLRMNRRISVLYDREHTIGHAYFMALKEQPTLESLSKIFTNNIIPLLQEYFYEDYEKMRLVLGDNRKISEEHQFIIAKDNDYADLFGGIDINLDVEQSYEINYSAFNKIESYRNI